LGAVAADVVFLLVVLLDVVFLTDDPEVLLVVFLGAVVVDPDVVFVLF